MEWYKQVFRWRTAASIIWLIILTIPFLILCLSFTLLLSEWVWSVYLRRIVFVIIYLFTLIIIQLTYTWTLSARLVLCKNRIQKIWEIISPLHLMTHCVVVVMATIAGMCLAEISGINLWNESSTEHQNEINEVYFITSLHAGYLGLIYSIEYFVNQEYILIFPSIQQHKLFRLKGHFCSELKRKCSHFIKWVWPFVIGYCMVGHYFKRIVEITFKLKSSKSSLWILFCEVMNPWLLWKLLLSSVLLHLSWSFGLRLFRVFHTQSIQFPVIASFTNQSNHTLLVAMKSNITLLKYLAYYDLSLLSGNSFSRRKQVLSLNSSGSSMLWDNIHNECINILRDFIKKAGGNTTDDGFGFALINEQRSNKKDQFSKGWSDIGSSTGFSLSRRHVFNERARLWSNGPVQVADSFASSTNKPVDPYQQLIQSKKFLKKYWKHMITSLKKKPVFAYFLSELPEAANKTLFVDSQLLIWSITALSQFSVSSYTEDTYGVVQQTLPSTVNNLLEMCQILDKYIRQPFNTTNDITNRQKALEINGKYAIKAAVHTGLESILNTFQDTRFLQLSQEQTEICSKFNFV